METTSKITSVTVYTNGAQVQRSSSVKLTKGENKFFFKDLPDNIDKDNIQAAVTGGSAILKDVSYVSKEFTIDKNKEIQELENKIKELESQIEVFNLSLARIESEKKFINILIQQFSSNEKDKPLVVTPDLWNNLSSLYRNNLEQFDQRWLDTINQKRKLDEQLVREQKTLKDLRSLKNQKQNFVQVVLESEEEKNIDLKITYLVQNASWYPVYDVRVDTAASNVNIAYQAMVTQRTGEDWKDVKLSISTAKPNISGVVPYLNPITVYKYIPSPPRMKSVNKKMDMEEATMSFSGGAVKDEENELNILPGSVESKGASVLFVTSGSYDVPGNNFPVKVTVNHFNLPAEFIYETVPYESSYAYLKAKLKNKTDYPFLDGSANIFADNHFIAKSYLSFVAPDAEFEISLGIDEAVSIEFLNEKHADKKEGLFTNKKHKIGYEFLAKIKNGRKQKINISMKQSLPKSQDADIQIELLEPQIKPGITIDDSNIITWTFSMEPAEEKKVPLKFNIIYPIDISIGGLPY